jgi:hypothetical protein
MASLYINNPRQQSQKLNKENISTTQKMGTPMNKTSSRSHSKSKSITYEYVIISM